MRDIKKRKVHPHCRSATQYAKDIVSGKIDACKLTQLACQRFLDELKDKNFPFKFNRDRAERFCDFVELMPHVKGKWAGKPLKIEPWQSFMIVNLFGWEDEEGLRRFRRALVLVPRKNGKTAIAAPIGLGMLTIESEPGAEIYCGAMNEEQASEVFRPAKAMADRAPGFKKTYGIQTAASSIFKEDGLSFFKKLIGKPGDGQSPYCAIHDEVHQHPNSAQIETMETGMGARTEPLQFLISTAGSDLAGPCKELHDYAKKVLEGHFKNDRFFALIYGIDEKDDWTDFDVWRKANPNLGVSVSEDFLQGKLQEAIQRTSLQNAVKIKHLNCWVNAGTGWLNMAKWDANADEGLEVERFHGCKAWVGIDLASKIDLTALMILIRWEEKWYLFGKYYLPEETINFPGNEHYQKWALDGILTSTPGARTDYHYLYEDLMQWYEDFQIQEIVYDPREAAYLMQSIMEEVSCPVVEFTQSAVNLSEPMKEFEAEINAGNLLHNGDPILSWSASNVVLKESRNKLYYPAKENNANKIDPIVAALMAMARAKATVEDEESMGFINLWDD